MSDTAHDWERGESLQWSSAGLPSGAAQTPFKCRKCGAAFIHYYNQQPNIYKAMQEQGIENICVAKTKEAA